MSGSALRGRLQAGLRLALFLCGTVILAFGCLAAKPWLNPRKGATWNSRLTSAWGRWVLWCLGARVRRFGVPPSAPFLLATNHLGYLDVAVIAAQVPCAFVAKSEVNRWPIFGRLASWGGTLFIDRKSGADTRRVGGLMAKRLEVGGGICLFPEGTSTGGEIKPFRSPLLELPASTGFPVHYAALRYRLPRGMPPASRSMCWWGDMEFLPHFLRLFRLRGMEAEIRFGAAPLHGSDRKELARDLGSAVSGLLGDSAPPRNAVLQKSAV